MNLPTESRQNDQASDPVRRSRAEATGESKGPGDLRTEEELSFPPHTFDTVGRLAAGIAHEINTPAQYLTDNARFLHDAFEMIQEVVEVGAALERAAKTNSITPKLKARAELVFGSEDLAFCREHIPAALSDMLDGIARIAAVVRALKKLSPADWDRDAVRGSEQGLEHVRPQPERSA